MAMTSIDKRLFPFVSYAFEELIDGRTMHGNRTVQSGLLDRGSLLNVLDDFAFGRLKLLWGNIWLLHRVPSSSCRCSSAFSQSTILSRRCLGASLFLFPRTVRRGGRDALFLARQTCEAGQSGSTRPRPGNRWPRQAAG